MVSIASVGTAVPEFQYSPQQIAQIADVWLEGRPQKRELFQRFLSSTHAAGRRFVLPPEQLLGLNGLAGRSALFERFGPQLGSAALREGLQLAHVTPESVSGLVFSSCSCPVIPSIDAVLIEQEKLPRTVRRIPVFQHGCAGGVVGLQIAAEMAKTRGTVVLSSVELCSLVFQRGNDAASQLVGGAIFADGAAAAVLSKSDHGLVVVDSQSYLVPKSRHLMGYDLFDDGFHLRLDRELPQALAAVAPEQVRRFLALHGLTQQDIKFWLFHPGGVKILDFLEKTFELDPAQSRWSREVLNTTGNVSSATVLFVLRAFLDSKECVPGDRVLMLGIGPGLTLELILFQWQQ